MHLPVQLQALRAWATGRAIANCSCPCVQVKVVVQAERGEGVAVIAGTPEPCQAAYKMAVSGGHSCTSQSLGNVEIHCSHDDVSHE